jgi:ApaG protein
MSSPTRTARDTQGAHLTVTVQPTYLEEQSDPAQHQYAWSYTVTIENTGSVPAQVVGRHWLITDATGHVEEVRGLAVVGHQPLIPPGQKFEYTSWTRLNTPHGHMQGTYFCMTEDAHWFDAEIPVFMLARAHSLH